jgi:SAM-dependent methyltransferase
MNSHPPSDALAATARYYEENAGAFEARTRDVEMAALYEPFLALVPAGGRILDAGCGPGRDALAFANAGHQVVACDASAAMVALASARLGAPALQLTFDQIEFDSEFDGIWCCASLLHVPRAEMPDILGRLHRALKPEGVLYASFKRGEVEEFREGRWFNDYTEEGLGELFVQVGGWEVLRLWSSVDMRCDRDVRWTNLRARRADVSEHHSGT